MPCYSPLKGWVNTDTGGIIFKNHGAAGAKTEVACGQCLGCRLDHSRTWAMRCIHEAELYDDNCFITLTYEKEPIHGSLNKKHFQKFMKRLRKKIWPNKVRYYHCGEYGEKLRRPHYHAILFGYDFNDKQILSEKDNDILYTSEMLADTWGKGFCTIGAVTFESCAYVTRYILKKVNGIQQNDHYLRCDENGVALWLQPEYVTMSRRPGIGKHWYEKYKTDLWPSDEVPVPGKGVYKKVPRYYETILKNTDAALHDQIKQLRKTYAINHKDDYTPERLMAKYKVKKAQIETLKRHLDSD